MEVVRTRPPEHFEWQHSADRIYAAQKRVSRQMRAARMHQAFAAERRLRRWLTEWQPQNRQGRMYP